MVVRIIQKGLDFIAKAVEWIIVLCLSLMVICVTVNVFARYCLKIGITWIEEFSTLMFVWSVFLGAFIALRSKAHLALGAIVKRFSPRFQNIDRIVVLVLTAAFLLAVSVGGIGMVRSVLQFKQKTAILRISSAPSPSLHPHHDQGHRGSPRAFLHRAC